jgi:hypothetical protein
MRKSFVDELPARRAKARTKQASKLVGGLISKTCIRKRDGEWVILGKKCVISPLDDGTWDLWICNPADLAAGLHQKTVNNIVRKLEKVPQKGPFVVLNGEAYVHLPGIAGLATNRDLLRLLGIRCRKRLTSAQKKALAKRLVPKGRRAA